MQAPAHHREQGRNYDVETLVRSASAAAGRMLAALAWYYPELHPADERRWNFLASAAGLYLASQSTELTRTDKHDLPDHLLQAMESCRNFVVRTVQDSTDRLMLDWAVGYWVLSGLFRQEPRANQAWLAAAIGETLRRTSGTLVDMTQLRPSSARAGSPRAARARTA
jgi:hypothetical protein